MNSDTKEVLERMMREKAKITKMITAEVAEKVKAMSSAKPQELIKVKSKSLKAIYSSAGAMILLIFTISDTSCHLIEE